MYDDQYAFGVNPASSKNKDACVRNDAAFSNQDCSSKVNEQKFLEIFNTECVGTKSCYLDLKDQDLIGSINLPASVKDGND